MRDRTIICLASNYDFDPTSKHHVMEELARSNDVLWVNWHGSRRPGLGKRDLGAIFEKLKQFSGGLKQARERLWVLTPVVLPFPGSRLVRRLNRILLVGQIRRALRQLTRRRRQLWTFAPDVGALAGAFHEELLVYYCVDEFALFTGYETEVIRELDERLCRRADLVLATSQALYESRSRLNENTVLMRHGVQHAQFARAVDAAFPVAPELAVLPRPIVGFYGLLNDWIDYELVLEVARRRPAWSFVFLGKEDVEVSALRRQPNIHLLGRKPHAELPSFCRGFDVATNPRKVNELTRHVNPIKLREYLAAGLPVVSTALPEARVFGEGVRIAAGAEDTLRALEAALADNTPEARRRRSDSVRHEGWSAKMVEINAAVRRTLQRKRALAAA